MITVEEALQLVLANTVPLPPETVPLAQAAGQVTVDDLCTDIDSPPHDRSVVDGYAVVAADLASGPARLNILEEVVAGSVPSRTVAPGSTTRVMTGAPIPPGADAVVKIEDSQLLPQDGLPQARVLLSTAAVRSGNNIVRRGASCRRGDVVVPAGTRLRPIEIGVLAEAGQTHIRVVRRPTIAVLSTGNELVPSHDVPGPGKIRNSNGPLLLAVAASAGGLVHDLGTARDERDELHRAIAQGLAADVMLISGGVSAGVLDLTPGVLAELGVEQVFHKVRVKPGKPLWFGIARGAGRRVLVFGLPGNPVSTLVCFELFVRPALKRAAGMTTAAHAVHSAILVSDFQHRGERPTYHPARLALGDTTPLIKPLAWRGSGDMRALVEANALAVFPAGDRNWKVGDEIDAVEL